MSVLFSQAETDVPLSAQEDLRKLAQKLVAKEDLGVRVVAYASGPEEQKSLARRVSLSRALAVRAFLIDLGVDNLRINVQAMGNDIPSGEPERADIFIE
jgi:outer membrane protein OmpA-like peptidoglycan-associated protein